MTKRKSDEAYNSKNFQVSSTARVKELRIKKKKKELNKK